MIDLRYVKKLIDIIDESSVDSIEITTEKGIRIRLSKSPRGKGVQIAAPAMQAMMQPPPALPQRTTPAEGIPVYVEGGGQAQPAAQSAPAAAAPASQHLEVKSPMVGTFYAAPEPGAKPYVTAGSRVSKGQVLCIIEAMKIMNEIESEYSGVVKEILVEDAQAVEFGQVLFRIDPNA